MLTKNVFEDRRSLTTRLTLLRVGAFVAFGALAISFWLLQVLGHERYVQMAENNRLRAITLRAPRGVIYDRGGRVLVQNRSSFTIALVRERSTGIDETLARLGQYTSTDPEQFKDAVAGYRNEPVFRAVPLIEHATLAQVAAVLAHGEELPDIDVQEVPTRTYPEDGLAAHMFGYVSEIRQAQLERPEFADISPGTIVGQTGLELAYNSLLMGDDGTRTVVVNSVGREIERVGTVEPVEGHLVQLTIDYDMQRALEEAFKHYGFNGAAVFLDPNTGEVLAMTSLPAYDPNAFAVGIDSSSFSALMNDPLLPFQNRAIQGRYMPGSTFKVAMAVAGLAERAITPEHREYCVGRVTILGREWQCNRPAGHGWVGLKQALKQSCNVFFYKLGEKLSIDTIYKYAAELGLVGRTGIDLPSESASSMPSTAQRAAVGERWYPGETISVAIGQGAVSVTPLALATMTATVANGGTLITPHVVRATAPPNSPWTTVPPPPARGTLSISPDLLAIVKDGMWMAVNEPGGTAYNWARMPGRDLSGKTGTAQVISLQGAAAARGRGGTRDLREHGWFVFFAPKEQAQVAGVIFGEHADHGYLVAPIAKYVMETYFAKQEGRPLPTLAGGAAVRPAGGEAAGGR